MKSNFRAVLSYGWQVVKRHKSLWILGFFASFVLNTGISEGAFRNALAIFQSGDFFSQISSLYAGRLSGVALNFLNIESFFVESNFFITILISGILLFVVYLATISYIGVIQATANIERSKKLNVRNILKEAHEHFATVLALNIVSRITLLLVFVITSIPLYISLASQNPETMIVSTFVFFLLFIPLSLAVIFVFMYGTNYAILNNTKFVDSILKGWELFTGNVLISVEIGLTMLLIRLVAILTTFVIAGTIFVPLAAILGLLLYANQILFFSILIILGAFLTIATYIIVNSIFATYYLTTWTTLFIGLTSNSLSGKLERVADYIINIFYKKTMGKKVAPIAKKTSEKILNEIKNEIKPQVQKLIKTAKSNYPQAEKIIKKEFEDFKPVVKRAGKALKKDTAELVEELKPILKKTLSNATKTLAKSFPETAKEVRKFNAKSSKSKGKKSK